MSHRLGLSVILLIALLVGFAVPAAGHDEPTPVLDFTTLVLPTLLIIDFEDDDPDVIRESARDAAYALLPVLLDTTPEPCYSATYIKAWLVFADYMHIAQAEGRSTMTEHLDRLADDGAGIGDTLTNCMTQA